MIVINNADLTKTLNEYFILNKCGFDSWSIYGKFDKEKTKIRYSRIGRDYFTNICGIGISLSSLMQNGSVFKLTRKNSRSSIILRVYDNDTKISFSFKVQKPPREWVHQSIITVINEIVDKEFFNGTYATVVDEIYNIVKKLSETNIKKEEKVTSFKLSDIPTQEILDEVLKRYQSKTHPKTMSEIVIDRLVA